jgi:hypothetical protein
MKEKPSCELENEEYCTEAIGLCQLSLDEW